MSRQKKKGTAFETGLVRWWSARTGDQRAHRLAPGGVRDLGDVGGIFSHGCEGIAECKDYASWSASDLERWEAEAEAECENAGADFVLLVVHRRGCDATGRAQSFGGNHCFVRLRDLPALHLGLARRSWPGTQVDEMTDGTWLDVELRDVADMVMAERDEVV